jgi:hypothetical protein
MTLRDKLEIGLKDDARFRRDNLPDFQKSDVPPGQPTGEAADIDRPDEEPLSLDRSPVEPSAQRTAAKQAKASDRRRQQSTRQMARKGRVTK